MVHYLMLFSFFLIWLGLSQNDVCPNVIMYYQFEDKGKPVWNGITDSSSNSPSNTGILRGSVPNSFEPHTPSNLERSTQSLFFREQRGPDYCALYRDISYSTFPLQQHDWSFSGWAQTKGSPQTSVIFHVGYGTTEGIENKLYITLNYPSEVIIYRYYDGVPPDQTEFYIGYIIGTWEEWHHFGLVHQNLEKGILSFYIDGSLVRTKQLKKELKDIQTVYFGAGEDADREYNHKGYFDELVLFHKALSNYDIEKLYQGADACNLPPPLVPTTSPTIATTSSPTSSPTASMVDSDVKWGSTWQGIETDLIITYKSFSFINNNDKIKLTFSSNMDLQFTNLEVIKPPTAQINVTNDHAGYERVFIVSGLLQPTTSIQFRMSTKNPPAASETVFIKIGDNPKLHKATITPAQLKDASIYLTIPLTTYETDVIVSFRVNSALQIGDQISITFPESITLSPAIKQQLSTPASASLEICKLEKTNLKCRINDIDTENNDLLYWSFTLFALIQNPDTPHPERHDIVMKVLNAEGVEREVSKTGVYSAIGEQVSIGVEVVDNSPLETNEYGTSIKFKLNVFSSAQLARPVTLLCQSNDTSEGWINPGIVIVRKLKKNRELGIFSNSRIITITGMPDDDNYSGDQFFTVTITTSDDSIYKDGVGTTVRTIMNRNVYWISISEIVPSVIPPLGGKMIIIGDGFRDERRLLEMGSLNQVQQVTMHGQDVEFTINNSTHITVIAPPAKAGWLSTYRDVVLYTSDGDPMGCTAFSQQKKVSTLFPNFLSICHDRHVPYYSEGCSAGLIGADSRQCSYCPSGAMCPGGNRLWALPGYWNPTDHAHPLRCDVLEACPGNGRSPKPCLSKNTILPNGSIELIFAYTGGWCSECGPTFYKSDSIHCQDCSGPGSQVEITIIALAIGLFWVFLGFASLVLDAKKLDTAIVALVGFQQLIAVSSTMVNSGKFSSTIQMIVSTLSILNFDIASLRSGCTLGTEIQFNVKLPFMVGLVFVVELLFIFFAWLRYYPCASFFLAKNERHLLFKESLHVNLVETQASYLERIDSSIAGSRFVAWRRRVIRMTTVLLLIVYLQMTTTIFKVLNCKNVGNPQQYRLMVNPNYVCYESTHLSVAWLAWLLLIVYVIGFPIMCYHIIHHAYQRNKADKVAMRDKYGFLIRGLKSEFFYFCLKYFVINSLIALNEMLGRTEIISKLFSLFVAFFIEFGFVIFLKPYESAFDTIFYIVMGFAKGMYIVFLMFVMLGQNELSTMWGILFVVVASIVSFTSAFGVFRLVKQYRKTEKERADYVAQLSNPLLG